jgi:hypothetical protein
MRRILLASVATAALAIVLHMPVSPATAQQTAQPEPSRDTATAPGNSTPGATAASPADATAGNAGTGTPGTASRSTAGAAQPTPIAQADRPDPLMGEDVSKVNGADVRGRDDKKIGDVETVLMKPDSKQVDRVVVDVGGVLGIGAHRVALPIDDLKWDPRAGAFRVSRTGDELKAMPEWKAPTSTSAATSTDTGMTSPSPAVTPGSTAPSTDQNAGTTK